MDLEKIMFFCIILFLILGIVSVGAVVYMDVKKLEYIEKYYHGDR